MLSWILWGLWMCIRGWAGFHVVWAAFVLFYQRIWFTHMRYLETEEARKNVDKPTYIVTPEEALLLTDLQAASLAWLMQVGYLNSIVTRFGDRVRVLDNGAGSVDASNLSFDHAVAAIERGVQPREPVGHGGHDARGAQLAQG